MKNKKRYLLLVWMCALSLLLCACAPKGQEHRKSEPTATVQATEAPDVTEEPAGNTGEQAKAPVTAGFVLVSAGQQQRLYALPESGEYSFTIRQTDEQGEIYENVVRLTPEGAQMAQSNCDNQSCVEQGEVTLENKDTRVLFNWIICLPHQVSVELYSAQEVEEMGWLNGAQ